jgi:hypothetical protein
MNVSVIIYRGTLLFGGGGVYEAFQEKSTAHIQNCHLVVTVSKLVAGRRERGLTPEGQKHRQPPPYCIIKQTSLPVWAGQFTFLNCGYTAEY